MSHHKHLANRQACLIDGDNLARGGQVEINAVRHVLDRIAIFTEGLPVTFAMQSRLAKSYMPAYAGHGWGLRFASMAPDAADRELLESAASYIASDVRTLVVVSGDHAFVELASVARLHVLAYRKCLSNRLRLAASEVTYLDDLLLAEAA